jgi:hypothetical protein
MYLKRHHLAGLLVTLAVVALLLPVLTLPQRVHASGTAQLFLSPSSQTVTTGANVVVTITEDSGSDSVNGVQANLSYAPSSFDSVSISSTAAFPVDAQHSVSGGSIQIARAAFTPVSGHHYAPFHRHRRKRPQLYGRLSGRPRKR